MLVKIFRVVVGAEGEARVRPCAVPTHPRPPTLPAVWLCLNQSRPHGPSGQMCCVRHPLVATARPDLPLDPPGPSPGTPWPGGTFRCRVALLNRGCERLSHPSRSWLLLVHPAGDRLPFTR